MEKINVPLQPLKIRLLYDSNKKYRDHRTR